MISKNDGDLFRKVDGKAKEEKFTINEKNRPKHFKDFINPVEIKKIKYKPSDSLLLDNLNYTKDAKGIEENAVNIVFGPLFDAFRTIGIGEPVELYYGDDKNGSYKIFDLNEYSKNENKEYIIDYPFKNTKNIKSAEILVTGLKSPYNDKSREAFYSKSEVSFYIKDSDIENDIIRHNLKNLSNNEDLIKIVGKNNPTLFRTLQNEKNNYKLDPKSILRLPNDVDIDYAIDNVEEIINLGEYITANKSHKEINISSIFPDIQSGTSITTNDNFRYKPDVEKAKIEKSLKGIDFSDKNFEKEKKKEFVDLDKGI